MNLIKKVSLAIIKSKQPMKPILSDFCSGHIKLSEINKQELEYICDKILKE